MTIPQNRKAQYAALIEAYRNDIGLFSRQVFGRVLRPKQLEFAEAFRTTRQISFKGGVGFGKTAVLAVIVWWSLICHDKVGVTLFAPTEGQIKSGIWKEIQQLYADMNPAFQSAFECTQTKASRLSAPAACFAEYRLASKDNPSAARGIHNVNNFVLVDEATGVDDEVFTDALINILTDENPKLCLISNPSKSDGYFWRTFNDPSISDDWIKITGKATDNPNLDEDGLRRLETQYGGKDSRQYRILVEGEFPLDSADGLIARSLIDLAVDNEEVLIAENSPYVWGVDPAKGLGRDRSVLVIRNDKTLTDIQTFTDLNEVQFAHKLRDIFQRTAAKQRPTTIAVDGIGSTLAPILKEFGLPVREVIVSKSPTRKPEKFNRLRDQLWWELKEWFETENVLIPNNVDLINELLMPTYNLDNGKIKVEGKKEIRKRLQGKSPDIADALALTFAVSTTLFTSKYGWNKPIQYDNLEWYE
ncbi:phage terminase large subunit [Agrobacterium rosae]|uniref:Mu-like prophage FluMu protein gp28 n=1 Tax=Agrobacterium rosae TaxID=1972867 RepID=A0A1R3TJT3_9HYPH|nr:phage terminase large subunit [Agrobacterium rosae]SCX19694.1 Mu-like prophage FluMu protein gp28 [Agrobacterium rosae]